MLFPGHGRSRHLLADAADKAIRSKDQEPTKTDEDKRHACPSKAELRPGDKQSKWSVTSPIPMQKEYPEKVAWPNGPPPAGPRKYLQRIGTYSAKRDSNTSESGHVQTVHDLSLTWTAQRNPSSLIHHASFDDRMKPRNSNRVLDSPMTSFRYTKDMERSKSCIIDSSRNNSPVRGGTVVTTSVVTTKKDPIGQTDGNCDTQPHSDFELTEFSPSDCLPGISQTSHRSVPGPENRTETSTTMPPPHALHRDIGSVRTYSPRCSSEPESVTSTSSSIAGKSSSSSVSSTLRMDICHICKKPPFKEKLKGCFACSRNYHKGCAKPRDR